MSNGIHDAVTATTMGPSPSPEGQDNLMAMSNALLGQNFANLDRVIMSDGTDFSFNAFEMTDFGFNAFDVNAAA